MIACFRDSRDARCERRPSNSALASRSASRRAAIKTPPPFSIQALARQVVSWVRGGMSDLGHDIFCSGGETKQTPDTWT
eukprot:729841-Amphidinium_carterae.1